MKQTKRHKKLLSEVQRVLKTVKDREVISDLKEVQIAFTDVDGEGVVLSVSINKKGKMKCHYDYIGMEDFEDQLYDAPSHGLLN
tara:strand:+ start:291 stop:542 length:252 start_codon:yes stop_codon:yes gene_type:complete